jgi:tape measure domain-containing protein
VATQTFVIQIQQTGAQQVSQQIAGIGTSAKKSADTLAFFRQALVAASAARAAAGFIEFADAAARIDNGLRVSTKSLQEFQRAQAFVYEISRKTRTEVEANATTYGRLLRATDSLGLTADKTETIMEGLALSIKLGGATSQEARNALVQFSQSLASGALRGDELRSVAEQLPMLATAIGKEFGVTGGQLLAFAKANPGILETKRVIEAVAAAVPQLREEAKKLSPTLTEGFISISNSAKQMLGTLNTATGFIGVFSRGLVTLGDNLNVIVAALATFAAVKVAVAMQAWSGAALGSAKAFIQLAASVRSASSAMALMQATFLVNPLTIWVGAIGAAVTALVYLYNKSEVVRTAVNNFFGVIVTGINTFGQLYSAISSNLPAWATWDNAIKVVAAGLGAIIQVSAILIAAALVPIARAITGLVLLLNAFGLATDETAKSMIQTTANLEGFVKGLLTGKQATADAGLATEQLTEKTKNLLSPLLGAGAGAKDAGDKVKGAGAAARDTSNAFFDFEQRILTTGINTTKTVNILGGLGASMSTVATATGQTSAAIAMSVPGFDNLTRVTEDWAKYTDKGADSTTKAAASMAATKEPTDNLNKSLGAVNSTTAAVAKNSVSMAGNFIKSAEASTGMNESTGQMVDTFKTLNPLIDAANQMASSSAGAFASAGNAAHDASAGVRELAAAYRELAAAKAQAGSSSSGSGDFGGARAMGGPVNSDKYYLVGEKGPELFKPNVSGTVVANDALKKNLAGVDYTASSYNLDGYKRPAGFDPRYTDAFGRTTMPDDPRYSAAFDNGDQSFWSNATKMNNISGDEGYMANMQQVNERSLTSFRQYNYDANSPFSKEIEDTASQLQMWKAALERYGVDAFAYSGINVMQEIANLENTLAGYQQQQTQAIEYLKKVRETTAAFKSFQAMMPALKSQVPEMDFQTLTPMQGGQMYGTNDRFGVGAAANNMPRASEEAMGAVSARGGGESKGDTFVFQMPISGVRDTEGFRKNAATIEAQMAAAVSRAMKRAGAK